MVTKKEFIWFVESVKREDKFLDDCYNLKIDLSESPIVDEYENLFKMIEKIWFTDDGIELVEWWLFEDIEDKKLYSAKDNSVIADVNKVEDLYDFMVSEKEDYLKD